jgi:cytochrome c6
MKRALVLLLPFAFAALAGGADHPGQASYRKSCAVCHAPDGTGNSPTGKALKVRDLTSAEVQEQTDEALTKVVADGKNTMPGFKSSMSPEQIREIVAFLRTLKKKQ